MKVKSILLSATLFAFIGCGTGGTDMQGAAGLPNGGMVQIPQQNQGQDENYQEASIDGIWYLFYDRTNDNKIDIRNYSELLELDRSGNVYDLSNQNQKKQIANFQLSQDGKLTLSNNQSSNTITFNKVANQEGNCFYATRLFGNQQREELWCKKPGTGGSNTTNQGNIQQGGDSRPQVLQPEGFEVSLKDYLYPYNTLIVGGNTSEYIHNYVKNPDGALEYKGRVTKQYKRVRDPQNNQIIQEFINNSSQPNKEDILYVDRIDSYSGLSLERYPIKVQKNSVVAEVSSDGVDLRCVVKDIVGGTQDLSSEIPEAIQNHLKAQVTGSSFQNDQFVYTGVVHIRCGTTSGETIDSYNVNGWGEVLSIYNYTDNTSRYEILDKKSIQ